jgi:DNA repair exonuclease SbcCD ATPase subunit
VLYGEEPVSIKSSSQELKVSEPVSEQVQSSHICFRVGEDVIGVWRSLPKQDRLLLTSFFRQCIASFSSIRSVIGIGIREFAELASILKVGYESCKDALRRCEERCKDIEEVRSEYRDKIKEYEEAIRSLKAELDARDIEIARLRSIIQNMSSLNKLKLLVCTLKEHNKELVEELEKYGLSNICE